MNKSYENYTATDFLKEDAFLKSLLFPSQEEADFRKGLLAEYPGRRLEINRAEEIFQTLSFNNASFSLAEKREMLEAIHRKIGRYKRQQSLHIRRFAAIAAGLAIVIGLSYVFVFNRDTTGERFAVNRTQGEPANDILLILSSDESVRLDPDAHITYSKEGKITVYSENKTQATTLSVDKNRWNKLVVPRGKRSFLTLADGSTIWINSGSTLEFPSLFAERERKIKVDGEIYIEVVKDLEKPFILNTSKMEISVLGTRFNVSDYEEDGEQSIVLVEGSVAVKTGKHPDKKILLPRQMLAMSADGIHIKTVNINKHISWKDGLLEFESENLTNVLAKLSRYYNVLVDCREDIREMKCTGKLVLFDDFEEVLQTISNTLPVKIEKTGNRIYIDKLI
ncbi:MAG: FecR domain-containing protein [Dysgonamonadaceae bacterium]|jgi:ferric-dicitrate binding protein FerR (iron transport regulator)|nr:FecR domain-containing protein [Dysgonamonadaceae bacterium]